MSRERRGTTWAALRDRAARVLPGLEEGTCFGTPALYVRKKFLARLKEDGETVVVKADFADRDVLLEIDPETFFLTDHYRPYPCVLVRLPRVRAGQMHDLLAAAWRRAAPRRLLAEHDALAPAPRAGPTRRRRRER